MGLFTGNRSRPHGDYATCLVLCHLQISTNYVSGTLRFATAHLWAVNSGRESGALWRFVRES